MNVAFLCVSTLKIVEYSWYACRSAGCYLCILFSVVIVAFAVVLWLHILAHTQYTEREWISLNFFFGTYEAERLPFNKEN